MLNIFFFFTISNYYHKIFPVTVSCAREAALDAQFLVLASNLGKEKASELHAEMTAFDSLAFIEDLVSSRL